MPRKALGIGLGLSALVAPLKRAVSSDTQETTGTPPVTETPGLPSSTAPIEIPIADILPNRDQPRITFDADSLAELSKSIKRYGLMQPIVVRSLPDGKMELIAGERRLRAAAQAGLVTIPVLIKEVDDTQMLEYALLENIQREDLNPIEKAKAYLRLMSEFALTQEVVAEKVGMDRSSVANTVRLLNLPETLWPDIAAGSISMGHAKVLLSITSKELQLAWAEQIKSQGLSVRQLEMRMKALNKPEKETKDDSNKSSPEIAQLETRLLHTLGTKVRVLPSGSGKKGGEIKIFYYSLDDLDRILEKIIKET